MRGTLGALMIAASIASIGCAEAEKVTSSSAPLLTSEDVDVAPDCQGIIDFVNTATFAKLDEYLPSNVAGNIVGQRGVAPFVTLADLSAVSQVGEARLTNIYHAALSEDFIDTDCAGIYDELAVSHDDAGAMITLVNTVSSVELHGYLPNAWNGATNLLNLRPFTQISQISATSGIGPVSFRQLRNAATLGREFEALAYAATGLHRDADIFARVDWQAELVGEDPHYFYHHSMTCFGIDPALLPYGTSIRAALADDAEVYATVAGAISYANRYHELTLDPAIGLANLEERIDGHSFFGCYISYADDPWSGNNRAFFVDTSTGFGVLTETRWSE